MADLPVDLLADLKARANALWPRMVDLRRDLHAHPELAFEEVRTAGVVSRFLTELGIEHQTGVAKTGVVALIEGQAGPGPVLALRADMDALPIHEANPVPYASQHPGKMHACGHDVHTSSLLGTTQLLHENRQHLHGSIKLVFQPSEEKLPGGANIMVQEGVLKAPDVQHILGQHVMPLLPAGTVGIRSGTYMASADEIYLTVHGKGGHAAHPHNLVDPVLIAAHLLTTLQTVVSRNADPRIPSVLSFGVVRAEGATNVIPDQVRLEGTFRTFNEEWRFKAHERIRSICHQVAEAMGGHVDVDLRVGYPVLVNDPGLAQAVRHDLQEYVGADKVYDLDLWAASEDFAYYTQHIPGCFYRIGTRNEARGIVHGLHTPQFDVDEDALKLSTGLMAWLALRHQQRAAQAG